MIRKTMRNKVLTLPRVVKAGLSPYKRRTLIKDLFVAIDRLNAVALPKKWNRRGRPANLHLIAVVRDIILAMNRAGLSTTYWNASSRKNRGSHSLLVEILDIVISTARKERRKQSPNPDLSQPTLNSPGCGFWQDVITNASRKTYTIELNR